MSEAAPDQSRPPGTDDELVERTDTEDYDLLTYGEVAARMSELIAAERAEAQRLRDSGSADSAVAAIERRISELLEARDRYRRQGETAEAFLRRFGLTPRVRT